MSDDLGDMIVRFKADLTGLDAGASRAEQKIKEVDSAAKDSSGGIMSMVKSAGEFASGMVIFDLASRAFDFLKDQIADTIKVAMDHQQIQAQTAQALKSTRDASGMTADSIDNLATSLSKVTPYSADSIQSMENIGLTFTNIGQKTFPQFTQAVLDVSTAMHQDLQSSAVQVGKALGDPLTGMTALQRIGVTFSASQKDVIKQMMSTGNIAGAQKVILQELSKEFGGSAQAAGKTFGGQLQIAQNRLEDLKIKIGTALLPILNQFLGWFLKNGMPVLERFADWFSKDGVKGISGFSGWISGTLIPALQNLGTWIGHNVVPVLLNFGEWFQQTAIPAFRTFIDYIQQHVIPAIQTLVQPIATSLTWIHDHWALVWATLGPIVSGVFHTIKGVLEVAWALIKGIFTIALDAISGNWSGVWNDMKDMVSGVWDGIKDIVIGGIDDVIGLINGFISGLDAISIDIGPVHIKPSIPHIPALAAGGSVGPGQWAIAGERGPELIYGGTGGVGVVGTAQTASMMGGENHTHVYLDSVEIAHVIGSRMDQAVGARYGPRRRVA